MPRKEKRNVEKETSRVVIQGRWIDDRGFDRVVQCSECVAERSETGRRPGRKKKPADSTQVRRR